MLNRLFRSAFTLAGALIGFGLFLLGKYILNLDDISSKINISLNSFQEILVEVLCVVIFGFVFFKLAPVVSRKSRTMTDKIEVDLQKVSSGEIVSGATGLIAGLIIAYLISNIYNQIEIPYLPMILSIITYLALGYFGVVVATKKGNDLFNNQKKEAGNKKGIRMKKNQGSVPKILDTSVIIDGRIADIMKTGFLEGPIVIPEFVLLELQHVSDSSDALKRNRGRRGLDVLNKIRDNYGIDIYETTDKKVIDEIPEVDIKLLKLAQIMHGKVVTNDFNLNKVAGIKGVDVLNINELANTLKPVVLPGEEMSLFLVKEGKEDKQAVAYLDDGTMIVVEDGKHFIGKTINVTVTSILQTSAGRMIFAKPSRKKGKEQ